MRRSLILPALSVFHFACAEDSAVIDSIDTLWKGFDPRALPLEVEVVKAWEEGEVHLESNYFTGEIFEGEKTRIFGYVPSTNLQVAGSIAGHSLQCLFWGY